MDSDVDGQHGFVSVYPMCFKVLKLEHFHRRVPYVPQIQFQSCAAHISQEHKAGKLFLTAAFKKKKHQITSSSFSAV